jgi:ABC-type amino acid transport substrate-binding protein
MKRNILIFSIDLVLIAILTACGTIFPQKIRMAVSLDDFPFAYQDTTTKQMAGMDVEVIKAMTEKENLQMEYFGVKREDLLSAVSSCQYDAGMGILPIRDETGKPLLFSDSYLQIGQSIVVRATRTDITGVESLTGKHVGVQIGSKGAIELAKDPSVLVVPYDTVDQMFQSLENGNVQAVVSENTISSTYIALSQGSLKSVGGVFAGDKIGIAICPNASNIRDRINQGLTFLQSEGKLDLLTTQWLSGKK